jgi:hypothetical protein
VILRGAEGHDGAAIGQCKEARLLAFQELLDHGLGARLPEAAGEDLAHRILRFVHGHRHGHALAGSQAIGLDHHRGAKTVQRGEPICLVRDADIARRRNAGALAQVLGEAFGAFETRRIAAGSEHRNASAAQAIRQSVD